MILNRTAGGQKKFKITVNAIVEDAPDAAFPGEYVNIFSLSSITITSQSGVAIPTASGYARAGHRCYFVMPAEDVTIS